MLSLERTSIKDTKKKNTWEPVGDQTKDLRGSTEIFSRPRGAISKNTAADCQNKPAEGTNCSWIQGCSACEFDTVSPLCSSNKKNNLIQGFWNYAVFFSKLCAIFWWIMRQKSLNYAGIRQIVQYGTILWSYPFKTLEQDLK